MSFVNIKKILHLDSKKRTRGTTSNFNLNMGNASLAHPAALSVLSVEMANSFYNINEYNNTLNLIKLKLPTCFY